MRKCPSTRVMEIFSEAATSDAARRQAYLERACGGDAELRAEVESLLATQARVDHFLDAPTVNGEGDGEFPCGADAGPDADSIEGAPAQVGRYTIIERIGDGGFGVVYSAQQQHPIRRDVALKIVKLGMDTRQVIARFETERQALARMDHPNIARIFDAGATVDGRPYFAMELVDGPPITGYCDANRLSIARRLELFVAVCQAVQHAHQKAVIHRDLKPSNILVAQVDGAAVPKVIDFGIAKAMDPGVGPAHTAATELRHFVGTPQYMSPEQAGAGDGDVDTRSDIYSLGVLLYELLAGVTPFDGDQLRKAPFEQAQRTIREQDPPRPSSRLGALGDSLAQVAERRGLDGAKLRKALAGELDWVTRKAIEKDRAQRYDTVGALAEDVRRYLANEPVLAGPPTALYRVRKFARRHRRPLLAAAAVAAALLLGLAGTTFGLLRAKRDRDRAEAALAEAEQVSQFLSEMLRSANPDQSQGNQVLVRDVLDRASRSIDDGALKNRPLVEAGIRTTITGAYESLGLYPQAYSHLQRALEIRQKVLGKDNRLTAQSMAAFSIALAHQGKVEEGEALVREALAIQERTLGAEHTDYISTLNRLGVILRAKRDPAGYEATLRRAVDLGRKVPPESGILASSLTNLGVALMDKGDTAEAEKLLTEALSLDRALRGEKNRNVARNLGNLANIRHARGDLKGAEAYFLQALAIQRQMLPPDHQDTAWTMRLLGNVRRDEGDLPAAEKDLRDAYEMERRVFGERHSILAQFLEDYGEVLHREGRRAQAVAARKEAFSIQIAFDQEALKAHPESVSHRFMVAGVRFRGAEFALARSEFEQLARIQPDEAQWLVLAGYLAKYLNDDDGHRELSRQLLERFGDSTDPKVELMVAQVCLLFPPADADLPRITKMVDRAVAAQPTAAGPRWDKGLAEYRAGHFSQAADCFARCRDGAPGAMRRCAVDFFRAMALHRAGNSSGAAAALQAALDGMKDVPLIEDGDLGIECDAWLICQIAAREAKAVLGDLYPVPPGPVSSASRP